jgi:putative membrane protein insertion efficiency factor
MMLSHRRYQKGNLTSKKRLLTFAAPHGVFLPMSLNCMSGSVPSIGTGQIRGSRTGTAPMKYSHRPNYAGALRRLPRHAGRGMIWIYRHTLSPLVGFNCRHLPTCSLYGDEAIERFGLWAGGWMTLARLLRCQPWGTSGIDNVPLTTPPGARWYLPWRFGRWRGVNGP